MRLAASQVKSNRKIRIRISLKTTTNLPSQLASINKTEIVRTRTVLTTKSRSEKEDQAKKERSARRRAKRSKSRKANSTHVEDVSERSDDDEDDREKEIIKQQTLANVVDYDEWLEAKTQKEIERQSQMAMSPKSILSVNKKDGIVIGSGDVGGRTLANQTHLVRSADKLAGHSDNEDGGRS